MASEATTSGTVSLVTRTLVEKVSTREMEIEDGMPLSFKNPNEKEWMLFVLSYMYGTIFRATDAGLLINTIGNAIQKNVWLSVPTFLQNSFPKLANKRIFYKFKT